MAATKTKAKVKPSSKKSKKEAPVSKTKVKAKGAKVATKTTEQPKKKKKSLLGSKVSATAGKVTVADLAKASADYNPRVITERQLNGLKNSYETYGDLSGIVLNRHTNTLVSGHQRLKTLEGKKTKVEITAHKDERGTVAVGFISVIEKDGSITKIPYREVNWSDRKAEAAANIAANAGGGQFDNNKLASLLEELDTADNFLVERIGLDPLTIRQLTSPKTEGAAGSSSSGSKSSGTKGFDEFNEDSFELEHTCPKCKFKW